MPTRPSLYVVDAPRRISTASLWTDAIWRFDLNRPGVTDCARTIDWSFVLPDGSRFTDPAWAELREALRCFLWSLRTDPPAGKRRMSWGSLVSIFGQMRVLVCWMAGEGYSRFADLDADAASRFLAALQERPGRGGQVLTIGTRAGYLVTLGRLYAQRGKLPDPVCDDVRLFLEEHRLRNRRIDRHERVRPYTPDAIATALVAGALRLIGMPADDVIRLRDLAAEAYAGCANRREALQDTRARNRLRTFTFSTLAGEEDPWRKPVARLRDVQPLIDRIYDACFVTIAWLTGARVSEILGLEAGCIEQHVDEGGVSVAFMRGRIFKLATGEGGKPHRWIAPEPVVRAIEVLERMSAPLRQKHGTASLWLMTRDAVLLRQPAGIPNSQNFVVRLNGAFAAFIGLPLHKGEPWHLTTHQGRKTFARFIGKRDRTSLHALQMHLGHISRIMTDVAYVGSDFELAELIGEEAIAETRAALEDLLTAPALAGHAGRMISARSRFRGRTRDGEVSEYIDFILRDSGMVLGVCDWGYCLYRREYAGCQGDDAGPNPALRTESVCVRCANFAVSERHRPVWVDRRQRNTLLLGDPRLDPESRRLAEQRVAECDRILAGLEGDADHGR
jgi:integrase